MIDSAYALCGERMTTQDYVLKTFIVYIFIKMLVFAPVAWMAFLSWYSDRGNELTPSAE